MALTLYALTDRRDLCEKAEDIPENQVDGVVVDLLAHHPHAVEVEVWDGWDLISVRT
jgi:hypothetical protein